ncbi:hypothetical protein Scep_001177 [Stephania cephalantha]|uniref:Uncharacterized protein n=1 Tax=Stephania cephalantha TaxID=152367 RepID=A0AAP0Q7G6_9MAGN
MTAGRQWPDQREASDLERGARPGRAEATNGACDGGRAGGRRPPTRASKRSSSAGGEAILRRRQRELRRRRCNQPTTDRRPRVKLPTARRDTDHGGRRTAASFLAPDGRWIAVRENERGSEGGWKRFLGFWVWFGCTKEDLGSRFALYAKRDLKSLIA